MPYKLRRVKGQPVPMSVLIEMERHPAGPWKVRDQMLNEMGWRKSSFCREAGQGVTMARPRKQLDVAEVLRLRLEGQSWPAIARNVRLGLGTVYQAYQTARKPPEPSRVRSVR